LTNRRKVLTSTTYAEGTEVQRIFHENLIFNMLIQEG
jgi:hypothetical protein